MATREQLVDTLVAWRMSDPGLSGGLSAEAWRLHYNVQELRQLQFLVEFYRLPVPEVPEPDPKRFANARKGESEYIDGAWRPVDEDPVEGQERELHHEYAVELSPKTYLGPMSYAEAVAGWHRARNTDYPAARVVERVVSDYREIRHVDPHISNHGAGPAADAPAPRRLTLVDPKGPESGTMRVVDPGCTLCGRDNRNGTHDALERTGHLGHSFAPAVPVEVPIEDEAALLDGEPEPGWDKSQETLMAAVADEVLNPESWRCEKHPKWSGDAAFDANIHIKIMHPGEPMYLAPDRVIKERS
jgi:hypothetical protein